MEAMFFFSFVQFFKNFLPFLAVVFPFLGGLFQLVMKLILKSTGTERAKSAMFLAETAQEVMRKRRETGAAQVDLKMMGSMRLLSYLSCKE